MQINNDIKSIPIFQNKLDIVPVVTVAIPTYKRGYLLREALESALNQDTEIPYEIIVLDNNPERNDATEQLMKDYQNKKGVCYYKNECNIGMTGNFNRIYSLSSSKLVAMLHDDDMLLPNYLSTALKFYHQTNADIYFPAYTSAAINANINKQKGYIQISKNDLLRGNIMGPPLGLLMDKSVFNSIGGFDEKWYPTQDYDFYYRALENNFKIIKQTGTATAYYRIEQNESLKEETILKFIEFDSVVIDRLLLHKNKYIKKILNLYFTTWKGNRAIQRSSMSLTHEKIFNYIQDQKKKESFGSRIVFHCINTALRAELRLRIIYSLMFR